MTYDVNAIRNKLKQSMSNKFSDPDEFRPAKATSTSEAVKYRFFFLPPLCEGDKIKSGQVAKGMENQFFITHGNHWVNDRPHPCPRVWDGSDCQICEEGFNLLKDEKIKGNDDMKRAVVKQWMPNTQYAANIYFPKNKVNPEDLWNRVMFYNSPKTVIDICSACLMRDDGGSDEEKEAFGVFYDENNAYLFELQVLKFGKANSYKTSKFTSTAQPVIKNADGTPNPKAIDTVLRLRHNLWAKIEVPDLTKIAKVYASMTDGDGEPATAGGFDEDETAQKPKAAPAGKKDPGGVATVASKSTTTVKKPVQSEAKAPEPKSKPEAADPLEAEAPLAQETNGQPVVKEVEDEDNDAELNSLLSQLDEE